MDLALALFVIGGRDLAKVLENICGFEVNAFDGVVGAAKFDSGPIDDAGGARERVAEIGLLEDFLRAGAGLAVGEELVAREARAGGAVNEFKEAVVEGVGHGDAVVEIPGWFAGAGFLGELVEEGVFAVVSRP